MRKCLSVSLILLLLLFQTTSIAFAAVQAAGADIPVVIDGGGTAYLIPELNSPLPKEVTIRVGNGRTGHFYIDFTETGVYRYTIKAGFIRNGEELPADEVFHLTITVVEQDGTLHTVSVINGDQSSKKTDEVRFRDTSESASHPSESSTNPHDTTKLTPGPDDTTVTASSQYETTAGTTGPFESTTVPVTRPYEDSTTVPVTLPYETTTLPPTQPPETTATRLPRIFRAPKTGDESHLAYYLLIAMASSAGLFGLALLYTVFTKRLIKKD